MKEKELAKTAGGMVRSSIVQTGCTKRAHCRRMCSGGGRRRNYRAGNRNRGRITYFTRYKTQIPVVELAIEAAALMMGTDKSRGYCPEMICADFLAGTNLDGEDPTTLLQSMSRFFKLLPGEQRQAFRHEVAGMIRQTMRLLFKLMRSLKTYLQIPVNLFIRLAAFSPGGV
jgi:hypothetical protein